MPFAFILFDSPLCNENDSLVKPLIILFISNSPSSSQILLNSCQDIGTPISSSSTEALAFNASLNSIFSIIFFIYQFPNCFSYNPAMSRRAAPPKRKCRGQVYESRHRQAPQARSDRSSPQARAPEDRARSCKCRQQYPYGYPLSPYPVCLSP